MKAQVSKLKILVQEKDNLSYEDDKKANLQSLFKSE